MTIDPKKVMNDILGSRLVRDLRRAIEENPLGALAVAGVALGSLAKLIDALSAAKGRRAYARQVDERIRRGQAQRNRGRKYDGDFVDYAEDRPRRRK